MLDRLYYFQSPQYLCTQNLPQAHTVWGHKRALKQLRCFWAPLRPRKEPCRKISSQEHPLWGHHTPARTQQECICCSMCSSRVGCLHFHEGRSPWHGPGAPSARAESFLTHPPNGSGDNRQLAASSPFLHLPSPPSTEIPGPSVTGSSTNTFAGYQSLESCQAQQKGHHQKTVLVAWHSWGRVGTFRARNGIGPRTGLKPSIQSLPFFP